MISPEFLSGFANVWLSDVAGGLFACGGSDSSGSAVARAGGDAGADKEEEDREGAEQTTPSAPRPPGQDIAQQPGQETRFEQDHRRAEAWGVVHPDALHRREDDRGVREDHGHHEAQEEGMDVGFVIRS
ncbi:MAG: hypothetical protein IPK16_18810 [Anaerolineales bacterium]|nr:hypothetical protein [Anaerolineales bacterium]